MAYVLATMENIVRWYSFDVKTIGQGSSPVLLEQLDLRVVPQFPDKNSAKRAAQALALTTWRYVRL